MENKVIKPRRSLRPEDSYYFAELDKIMAEKKKEFPKASSPDKLPDAPTTAGSQSSGVILESAALNTSIYPKLPDNFSENKSDGIDETDKTKRKNFKKHQQKGEDKKVTETLKKEASKPKPPKNTNLLNYMIIIMISILVIIFGIIHNAYSGPSTFSTDSDFNMTTAMANLAKNYLRQLPSTWSRLIFGIQEVKIHSRPTVFLLVHSGSDDSSSLIAKAVGGIASKYLRSDEESPLILDAKDFHAMDDHGELHTKYKEKLETSGSMVVLDLESTPGSIAQGLRYYCDEYNPLVKSAAIFLTVNLNKCNADLEKFHRDPEVAANGIAEKCLTSSWSKELGPDILQPLLSARVMGIVLKIEREN